VQRYGQIAIEAIADLLFRLPTTSELVSILVLVLARVQDEETKKDRQALLISALESRHPSMRYLAAAALGEIGDFAARRALNKRLDHERNRSVATIIRASLR
jgi:HEAT repeat protein